MPKQVRATHHNVICDILLMNLWSKQGEIHMNRGADSVKLLPSKNLGGKASASISMSVAILNYSVFAFCAFTSCVY